MRGGDGTFAPALRDHVSAVVWGDFVTGQVLGTLTSATGSVSDDVDGRGTIRVDISLAEWLALQGQVQPWRHFLAWVTSGWVQVAGPVVDPPMWTPSGVSLTAVGAEAWLGRVEVLPPSQVAASLVVASTVSRGDRTSQTRTDWAPLAAARTAFTNRAPRAIAASLVDLAMSWGASRVPTIGHTFINVGEGGTMSVGWDGIDHKTVADALADVLAGFEWRLDPYWSDPDNLVVAWDLLVGSPKLVRDPMPIGWPAGPVQVRSVTGDGSSMCNVSSAVSTNAAGMAINRVARDAAAAPVLMSTVQVGRESATGAEVQAVANAGLQPTPQLRATMALPINRMLYLPLGSYAVPDWPDDAPISGQVRLVSYTVDLESLEMTATVIGGGIRGRR